MTLTENQFVAQSEMIGSFFLLYHGARELLGEADAEGIVPAANVEMLRALLFRASLKIAKWDKAIEEEVQP